MVVAAAIAAPAFTAPSRLLRLTAAPQQHHGTTAFSILHEDLISAITCTALLLVVVLQYFVPYHFYYVRNALVPAVKNVLYTLYGSCLLCEMGAVKPVAHRSRTARVSVVRA